MDVFVEKRKYTFENVSVHLHGEEIKWSAHLVRIDDEPCEEEEGRAFYELLARRARGIEFARQTLANIRPAPLSPAESFRQLLKPAVLATLAVCALAITGVSALVALVSVPDTAALDQVLEKIMPPWYW